MSSCELEEGGNKALQIYIITTASPPSQANVFFANIFNAKLL